jgi:hypothetical protein
MATATVDILLRRGGPPSSSGQGQGTPESGQGSPIEEPKDPPKSENLGQMFKNLPKLVGAALKKTGISFGVSSMLKQSQIFTSTIGVIFQLFGAMVDVMLAPLIPYVYPLIGKMGGWIPIIAKWSETAVDWLFNGPGRLIDSVKGKMADVQKGLTDWLSQGFTDLITDIGSAISTSASWVWEQIKGAWETAKGLIQSVPQIVWQGIASSLSMHMITIGKWWVHLKGFLPKLLSGTGKLGFYLIKGAVKLLAKFLLGPFYPVIKLLGGIVGKILKIGGKVLKFVLGTVWTKLKNWILRPIWNKISQLGGWIWTKIEPAVTGIKNFIARWASKIGNTLTKYIIDPLLNLVLKFARPLFTALSKIPMIGKGFKAVLPVLDDAKALRGAATRLVKQGGKAAKYTKAIPVLGAVATAGFGAYETYKNWKEYGAKAGLATLGKTVLATGLAAGGQTWASTAVDLGGTMAINKFLKTNEAKRQAAQQGGRGWKGLTTMEDTNTWWGSGTGSNLMGGASGRNLTVVINSKYEKSQEHVIADANAYNQIEFDMDVDNETK